MAALVLRGEDAHRLGLADPVRALWMVLGDEVGKGLADDHADLGGRQGFGLESRQAQSRAMCGGTFRTMSRAIGSGMTCSNRRGDIVAKGTMPSRFQRYDLGVVRVRELDARGAVCRLATATAAAARLRMSVSIQPTTGLAGLRKRVLARADADVEIRPAPIESSRGANRTESSPDFRASRKNARVDLPGRSGRCMEASWWCWRLAAASFYSHRVACDNGHMS